MISRSKFTRLKHAALAILAAAAPLGAAGAVAAATAVVPVNLLKRMGYRPGQSIENRPLTGLEIRAVRMQKRNCGTNRSGRSKYVGNGIPARVIKFQKRQAALSQAAA